MAARGNSVETSDGPAQPSARGWLTAHLAFEGALCGAEADRLLLHTVAPLVQDLTAEGLIDHFFFLRYNVPGHHLRLRFGDLVSEPRRNAVRQAVAEAVAASPQPVDLSWHDYEPEVERYGGPVGVLLAEDLFVDASRVALQLLHKFPPGDRSSRLGKGLLTTLVLLWVFAQQRRDASRLAHYYTAAYLHSRLPDDASRQRLNDAFVEGFDRQASRLAEFVEVAWEAMQDAASLTPELDAYRDAMDGHRQRLEALCRQGLLAIDGQPADDWGAVVWRLVPSYLHMMNNRLGIELEEEAYLASLTHLTLSRGEHETGDPQSPSSKPSGHRPIADQHNLQRERPTVDHTPHQIGENHEETETRSR